MNWLPEDLDNMAEQMWHNKSSNPCDVGGQDPFELWLFQLSKLWCQVLHSIQNIPYSYAKKLFLQLHLLGFFHGFFPHGFFTTWVGFDLSTSLFHPRCAASYGPTSAHPSAASSWWEALFRWSNSPASAPCCCSGEDMTRIFLLGVSMLFSSIFHDPEMENPKEHPKQRYGWELGVAQMLKYTYKTR